MNLRHRCQISRLVAVSAVVLSACTGDQNSAFAPSRPLFELLSPRSTGVDFVNHLPEKPDFNILA
jgi:hypothetical protein